MRTDFRTIRGAARAALVVAALGTTAGCTDWAGYDLDALWAKTPFLGMLHESVAFDPYEMPRLPAEHSIPLSTAMGDLPPRFSQTQLDSAAATLTNPFAGQASAEVMARGQAIYERQCSVCHGTMGAGDGTVVGPGKYPFAPPINGAATAGRSDGYVYGVVAVGRGLMPAYGWALAHDDRWAVVSYVRQLQQQGGAVAPAMQQGTPTAVDTAQAAGQNTQPQ